MKKLIPSFIALLVLSFQTSFAGNGPELNQSQFKFTTVDLTQNSWDYAYLHYNVNDLNTGETLEIPSFLINYEVKDKAGAVVSKGSGLYMNVMDAKLGSEEDYTISIYTMINGQKVSQCITKKASPKKLAMKVDVAKSVETGALASDDIAYSFTRPKFSNRSESENLNISPSDVYVNIALNDKEYKIEAGANHPKISEQASYQALQNDLKTMTADGKNAEMTVKPVLTFKGEKYTDNQSFYEVTAQGFTEVNSLEEVASK
jgi:hypothetical protein